MTSRREPNALSVTRALRAVTLVLVVVPLFALAAWLDHGGVRSWPALWADVVLLVVLLLTHTLDRRHLRRARYSAFVPARVFAQTVVAVWACALAGVVTGLHGGSFLLLPVLAFVVLSLLGNRTMTCRGVPVLVTALAVETGLQLPALSALWSTVLFSGSAVVLAAMVDEVVHGTVRATEHNRLLAELAADTSALQDWPRDLTDLAPRLARAMDVRRYAVLTRTGSRDPLERVFSWPEAEWPSWEELGTLPQQSLEHLRPLPAPALAVAPAHAGAVTVVVVTPSTSLLGSPVDTTALSTVASLLAAMVTRSRLISGLVEAAETDELTGVANRRRLFEALAHEMARARRSRRPLAVAMIDLDYFKQFNDTFGHSAGDDLLQRFALRTTARVRAQDLVARYGGEEFCLVLPETDATGALALLEGLRAAGAGADRLGRRVTFSAGLATWDGTESVDQLVYRADASLYRAKAAGRDRVAAAQAAG